MASYTYRKLRVEDQEIRLIKLMPGEPDEDISFSILHTPLVPPKPQTTLKKPSIDGLQQTLSADWMVQETLEGRYLFTHLGTLPNSWTHPDPSFDNSCLPQQQKAADLDPKYEALSYTWGSRNNPVTAHVLDLSCSKQSQVSIQIGENLACALKHLRYHEETRILWVDAVCINQNDIHERNAQVKRMGLVYSLASRVVIWLGSEGEDSTHALSTLEYLGNQVEYLANEWLGDSPGAAELEWWNSMCPLPYDERTWLCLIALFRRPWFSRVWVLQEALLSSHQTVVQCGDISYPWSTFRKAMIALANKQQIPQWLRSWLYLYRTAVEVTKSTPRLLQWVSHRQCTDPRDKIYGILSLLPPSLSERIEPQYSRPVILVYMSTFLAHLDFVKRLSLLVQCHIQLRCSEGPSWIPNWATGDISFARFGYQRQPSGLSAAHTKFLPPNTLEVVGRRCAQICSIGGTASLETVDVLPLIMQWAPDGLQTKAYVSGGSLFDAFLEVVFQGRTRDRTPKSPNFPSLEELRQEYLAMLSGASCITGYFNGFLKLDIDLATLFKTREGYLGLVSPSAKEDDYVCVLLGCDRPMILRPTASGEYLVVGQCFVHGLMDAESILGPIPDPWQMKVWKDEKDSSYLKPYFYNTSTGEDSFEDPRLPPLSSEWEIVERKRMPEDPYFFREFRNTTSGETLNSDPRMLQEALEKRGVKLETFRLV